MRTTYLTTVLASFNPFQHSGAVPRLFLGLLPPRAHRDMKITSKVLPRSSQTPATLELGFKDGKSMKWTWPERTKAEKNEIAATKSDERVVSLQEIVEEVNRHARILGRKEELDG